MAFTGWPWQTCTLIGWSISCHSSLKALCSPGASNATNVSMVLLVWAEGVQPAWSTGRTGRSQSAKGHADRPVFNIRLKISLYWDNLKPTTGGVVDNWVEPACTQAWYLEVYVLEISPSVCRDSCVSVRSQLLLILHTVCFLSSHHTYYSRCNVKTGHCDSEGKDGQYGEERRMEADVPWKNWGCKPSIQSRRLCTRRSALHDSIVWTWHVASFLGLQLSHLQSTRAGTGPAKGFLACWTNPLIEVSCCCYYNWWWGFGKIKMLQC